MRCGWSFLTCSLWPAVGSSFRNQCKIPDIVVCSLDVCLYVVALHCRLTLFVHHLDTSWCMSSSESRRRSVFMRRSAPTSFGTFGLTDDGRIMRRSWLSARRPENIVNGAGPTKIARLLCLSTYWTMGKISGYSLRGTRKSDNRALQQRRALWQKRSMVPFVCGEFDIEKMVMRIKGLVSGVHDVIPVMAWVVWALSLGSAEWSKPFY